MEVIGSKMFYIGPLVPTDGVVNSIWINNTTGGIYRCTSIAPLTYTPVGGGAVILPPADYNDFTNSDLWIPFYGDPTAVQMTIAPTGVTLTGLILNDTNPLNGPNMIGLVSKGVFYPDPVSGLLRVKVNFDSYVNPTDQTATSDSFYFGMMVIPGHGAGGGGTGGMVAALGRVASTGPIKRDAILGISTNQTGLPLQTVWDSSTDYTIVDGDTFAFEMQFGARTLSAGTVRTFGHIQTLLTGTGGITDDVLNNTVTDTSNLYDAELFIDGVRFVIGCWPHRNSNIGSARIIGFSLLEGNWHL